MNKAELISAIASKANITKVDARKALDAFVDAAGETMKQGERLTLVGFGSFSVVKRNARNGRNPRTGKNIKIAAKNVVRFKAGADLNKLV